MNDAIVWAAILLGLVARLGNGGFFVPSRALEALRRPFWLPIGLLLLAFANHAMMTLLLDASYHQTTEITEVLRRLPVRIINHLGGRDYSIAATYGNGFAAIAILETLSLAIIYTSLTRPRIWQFVLVGLTMTATIADSLHALVATSADMYSYVGFALLGIKAYSPPNIAFAGSLSAINAWWGTPMVPCPYGPLWIELSSTLIKFAPTLLAKIVALRLFDASVLVVLTMLLFVLGYPVRVIAIVALNPALMLEFIDNVHNDLFAVTLLVGARIASSRGAVLPAIALGVAAALVKLPFLLLAALAFVPLCDRRKRAAAYAATTVIALLGSWLWGGHPYLLALQHHVAEYSPGHLSLKAVALVAILLAFVRNTWFDGFLWTLPAIGAALYPWYLVWSFPYALASKRMMRNIALALPLLAVVTDATIGHGRIIELVQIALYCVLLGVAIQLMFTRRRRKESGLALPS